MIYRRGGWLQKEQSCLILRGHPEAKHMKSETMAGLVHAIHFGIRRTIRFRYYDEDEDSTRLLGNCSWSLNNPVERT